MSAILPYAVSAFIFTAVLWLAGTAMGPELVPPPAAVLGALVSLARSGDLFRELGITVVRGAAGIALANVAGVSLGLAAGFVPGALRMVAPLVAALQSCPPVVWISLVMVWAGTGGTVPVATVFAAAFPFVFSTTAQGVMGLDGRIFAMSRLYGVPKTRILAWFVLPGITPYWLAGFSTVLAAGWKSAAVAEFLGSHEGIGSRIFWSYRKLNMEELYAWALALVILGVVLECGLITPLRRRAAALGAKGAAGTGGNGTEGRNAAGSAV